VDTDDSDDEFELLADEDVSSDSTPAVVYSRRELPPEPAKLFMLPSSQADLGCREVFSVPGDQDEYKCPESCPYLAEDESDENKVCQFQCVAADQCSEVNENKTIADDEEMICRSCEVDSCEECLHNGKDVCKTCAPRFTLKDGECLDSKFRLVWNIIRITFFVVIGLILLYCCQLCFRKNVNDLAVKRGFRDRYRSRNKPPISAEVAAGSEAREGLLEDPYGKPYPLFTNLCVEPVCGPGLLLYFNFQCMLILWATLVIIAWGVTASKMDKDLFWLGLKAVNTPRQACENVNWGHKKQKALMSK
jgi:hypothetical protein